MGVYDKENQADDYRNNKMSDLACDNDYLRDKLVEIREVYAGSEGIKAPTASEQYLMTLCRMTYKIACDALDKT